ncbi:MAG: hypothetical protein WD355_02950 [Balneolaceae bacterium]
MWQKTLLTLFLLVAAEQLYCQEIEFGGYGSYTIELNLGAGDMEFFHNGGPVISNSGNGAYQYTVDISEAYELDIVGVKYLDAVVQIEGPDYLYLDGDTNCASDTCRIPLTLQAAYSNSGLLNNSPGNSTQIAMNGNDATVRFPILARQFTPPGPPPPPPTEAFDQSLVEETAVLYLYGSIEAGNLDAGSYFNYITITISYE